MTICDDQCKIRVNCDYLSGFCQLTPREVARQRPDLIRPSRSQKLALRDELRRKARMDRDNEKQGVFARRRIRQRAMKMAEAKTN